MLKTRVITALVLLAVLLPVLYFHSFPALLVLAGLFFCVATWECFRLFRLQNLLIATSLWCLSCAVLAYFSGYQHINLIFGFCVAIWVLRLIPSLAIGLPSFASTNNRLLCGVYSVSIAGSFVAIAILFQYSSLYLLSVMALVWLADIGAYFTGKAFGKHKLAPSISPGKSWEGAIGGLLITVILTALSTQIPALADTFAAKLQLKIGWFGFIAIMTIFVGASIVGDLFESQLKRRAEMKDSSNLLPGHGGVLDRIDALIPALPFAAFLSTWL